MNDNKKIYKKLTTIFWWVIACFPILFVLGYFVFYIFNKNYINGFDIENVINDFYVYFNTEFLDNTFFGGLLNSFINLFELFGFDLSNKFCFVISFVLGWFILAHLLHLIVDLILLLPRICQKFIERV